MNQEGGFTHRRGAVGAQHAAPLPGAPAAVILFILFTCCGTACSTSVTEIGEPIGPAPQHVRSSTGPTTWYIRPDGGPPDACTGQVDAAYPGTGSGKPCAWDHPFRPCRRGGQRGSRVEILWSLRPAHTGWATACPGLSLCDPDGAFECHMAPHPQRAESR